MRISHVKVTNFRSIEKLDIDTGELIAVCGPNSCGKSNLLRALKFAFLPEYSAFRMADNVCNRLAGPNASCKVSLTFSRPTSGLARSLALASNQPFTYAVTVKRNGKLAAFLNRVPLTAEKRSQFLAHFLIVHVPPIRDIAADGLEPFKATLAEALKKTRGTQSFATLGNQVRSAVEDKGRILLNSVKDIAKNLLGVDELTVNADALELDVLLSHATLKVKTNGQFIGLDKLGTGHQSSVIIQLYRQLGKSSDRFVLYLFEEPDNHLHPGSTRAIGKELSDCSAEANSQVFITTHSPYLLNQFSLREIVALSATSGSLTVHRKSRMTRSDREIRIALGKYGLRPSEALLADKVVVVEGLSDVTLLRTLIELKSGKTADQLDILIVPAGGKDAVADLAGFLNEIGANWFAVFDWDAVDNTSVPLISNGLTATEKAQLLVDLVAVEARLHTMPPKTTKSQKLIAAMKNEVNNPPLNGLVFDGSVLDRFLRKNALISATAMLNLKKAARRAQPNVCRQILEPARIWLWSKGIEGVILNKQATELHIENLLRAKGHTVPSNPTQRRNFLLNLLHDCAHEPDLLEEIIRTAWTTGLYNNAEIKSAAKFACGN